jgi:hypothetical protein
MLYLTTTALILVALTVTLHALGMTVLLRLLMRSTRRQPLGFWPITWLLVRTAWALILMHAAEISLWALFYLKWDLFPNAESAFYFSGVTYATIGYGDLVLPAPWRLFGPIEGLTGIMMCGLSGAFFFAIVSRTSQHLIGHEPPLKP